MLVLLCMCVFYGCIYVCVFSPTRIHPSCPAVDLARTAEFVSEVEAGHRSDTGVGGLL